MAYRWCRKTLANLVPIKPKTSMGLCITIVTVVYKPTTNITGGGAPPCRKIYDTTNKYGYMMGMQLGNGIYGGFLKRVGILNYPSHEKST